MQKASASAPLPGQSVQTPTRFAWRSVQVGIDISPAELLSVSRYSEFEVRPTASSSDAGLIEVLCASPVQAVLTAKLIELAALDARHRHEIAALQGERISSRVDEVISLATSA